MNGYQPELRAVAIILGIACVAALASSQVSADAGTPLARPVTPAATALAPRPAPTASVVAGPFDGLPTALQLAKRRPIAVAIDNFFPDARPQSGISRASLVFEAVTEGGITRLLGIFLERDAPRIGPIRSARPYFVSWAAGFQAGFVHAGGSPSALALLRRSPGVIDVDALTVHRSFSRERDRLSPHNVYGSTTGARVAARGAVNVLSPDLGRLEFGRAAPLRARGPSSSIIITFSTPEVTSPASYAVTYRYVRRQNSYAREQGGVPFMDRLTRAQVAAQNVIALYTRVALIAHDPLGRVSVSTTGAGQLTLFQNGRKISGRWSKATTTSPLTFTHLNGQPLLLVPGHTWIEAVPPGAVSLGPPA